MVKKRKICNKKKVKKWNRSSAYKEFLKSFARLIAKKSIRKNIRRKLATHKVMRNTSIPKNFVGKNL